MSTVTTHVLDTSTGRPAAGVAVRLSRADGTPVAVGHTDADGRLRALGPDDLPGGDYRLHFATGDYYAEAGVATFFPAVLIAVTVTAGEHHHVPLLLGPHSYSTYRGS